jgi:membrane-bound metal-dependent hydrolase YbcI (DUF457 family)
VDIVTHAMTGVILAGPMTPAAPLTAGGFVLGSLLPDLDALGRLGGKRAFLRWHQTYTHSLPLIPVVVALVWPIPGWLGVTEPWVPVALGAGMLLHVLMDATNTYGVALLAPFVRKRYCTEWVFLVDAPVIAVSLLLLAMLAAGAARPEGAAVVVAAVFGVFLAVYWPLRWATRRRAWRLRPEGTRSLTPTAAVPWRFFGYTLIDGRATLFELSALSGTVRNELRCETFDRRYQGWLDGLVEYGLMRELSPGYHAVKATRHDGKTTLVCRDLRIRNFGGRFGMLEVTFDGHGKPESKVFHV